MAGWMNCWHFWTLISLKQRRLCVHWRVWPLSFTWQPSAALQHGNRHTHTQILFLFLCFVTCLPLILSLSDSRSRLLWVPAETLGRALRSCQLVLEGSAQPVSNQNYFQSAVQTTVGILDSVLYLTSRDVYCHKNAHYTHRSYGFYLLTLFQDEAILFFCHNWAKKKKKSLHQSVLQ